MLQFKQLLEAGFADLDPAEMDERGRSELNKVKEMTQQWLGRLQAGVPSPQSEQVKALKPQRGLQRFDCARSAVSASRHSLAVL